MGKTLIVSGHTDLGDSVVNKRILKYFENEAENTEIVRLDSLYPDFKIDVEAEQGRLIGADTIVLQFPLFWYSLPSILERWMEETFVHGFSHGSTGDKLKGKRLIASVTAGAPEEMYSKTGAMGHDIEEFMIPVQAACNLCGMKFDGIVFTGGVSYALRNEPGMKEELVKKAEDHAERLIKKIKG